MTDLPDATSSQVNSQRTDIRSVIGRRFEECPRTALALAVITIGLDFIIVTQQTSESVRACMALTAFALAVYLTDGDHRSIGLHSTPKQGWLFWFYASLKIAAAVGFCVVLGLGALAATGHKLDLSFISPTHGADRFRHMCFVAPVMEETIYRVVACGLVAGIVGNRPAIVANGLLFGCLHVLYGNPSPENLVGGFFLAWAYLKSETILIPLILHSIGNWLVFSGQLVAWRYFVGPG